MSEEDNVVPFCRTPTGGLSPSHPIRAIVTSSYMPDTAWVFAKHGDFIPVMAKYLYYPPLTAGKVIENPEYTYIVQRTIPIPTGTDPWWYVYDVLRVDPLMVLTDLAKLDVTGLHRFGYAYVNIPEQIISFVFPRNEKGLWESVWKSRRGPFVAVNNEVVSRSPTPERLQEVYSYGPSPMNVAEDFEDAANTAVLEKPEELLVPPYKLFGTLATRDVDWKGTQKFWLDMLRSPMVAEFVLDEAGFHQFALGRRWGFKTKQDFLDLDVHVKRDLLLLPNTIILSDGTIQCYRDECRRIVESGDWAELKNHLKARKERVGGMFGKNTPIEMFVAAYCLS